MPLGFARFNFKLLREKGFTDYDFEDDDRISAKIKETMKSIRCAIINEKEADEACRRFYYEILNG